MFYLADKSAYEQQRHSDDADSTLVALASDARLAICEIVALELLYSARGPADYAARRSGLDALIWLPMDAEVGQVALDIQRPSRGTGATSSTDSRPVGRGNRNRSWCDRAPL